MNLPRPGTQRRTALDLCLAGPTTVHEIAAAIERSNPEATGLMVRLRHRGLVECTGYRKHGKTFLGVYRATEAARKLVGDGRRRAA